MSPTRRPISRRRLLRGTGAALALPWLEAMLPRTVSAAEREGAAPSDAPVRLAALFVPNGVRQDMWTPHGEGRDFKLSPTLEPLADVRDQLLVLTNAGLVQSERQGRNVIYFAAYAAMTQLLTFLTKDCCCGRQDICTPLLKTLRS